VIALVARLGLRMLHRMGVRNVYVRRFLWVLAVLRWLTKRRQNSTQVVRLRHGENLVISMDKRDAHIS
jgi:hypothetical protein